MGSIIFHYDLMYKFFDYYDGGFGNRTEFIIKMKEHNISEREAIIIWQSFDMVVDRLKYDIQE